jgi:integrase
MAYLEKRRDRNGNLVPSGRFWGEVDLRAKGGPKRKRSFTELKAAERYERYVRDHDGEEPPELLADGNKAAREGRSFREIAARCKERGGPNGTWGNGKDPQGLARLAWCVEQLGDYDIERISKRMLYELLREPLELLGRSKATINRTLSAASAVFTWAGDCGLITAKPEFPFVKGERRDREESIPITWEQELAIIAWLNDHGYQHHATCVDWLVWTGMRRGELMKLRPEQIGNDRFTLEASQTKNGRQRTAYVDPARARGMRALIASGARPKPRHLLNLFKEAAKSAGTDLRVNLHSLRHTLNTRMAQAGVLKEIREFVLGHNRRDGNDIYTHLCARKHFQIDGRRSSVQQQRGTTLSARARC